MTKVVGVIPCRYNSSRFPGKPLCDILGKPMMWHVYQQAVKARSLSDAVIATDDHRIHAAAVDLDLKVIMTGDHHATGTDRVAEVAQKIDADIYVNVQGDEPLIAPAAIDDVVTRLLGVNDPLVMASNGYRIINDPVDAVNVNVVKVVLDAKSTALCYSRQPIPYPKGEHAIYRQQLGLYAFTQKALTLFSNQPQGELELTEGVEMLRYVEHGYKVLMVEVDTPSVAVDTPEDLERARKLIGAPFGARV